MVIKPVKIDNWFTEMYLYNVNGKIIDVRNLPNCPTYTEVKSNYTNFIKKTLNPTLWEK